MPIYIDSLAPDELKAIAVHQVARFERATELTNEQVVKTSGWLSATLLAINGGGVLATFNLIQRIDDPVLPAVLFGVGILFVILNGVVVQSVAELAAFGGEEALTFWRQVALTGRGTSVGLNAAQRRLKRLERWYWTAPACGWASGVLGIAGAIFLAADVGNPAPGFQAECAILQRDMMQVKHQMADSRDVFVALGCQYQPVPRQ